MMKRKCELCSRAATSYCQSDEAILCWECDAHVHGANFLVAKHSRVLLCTVCQAPTRWTGTGLQLCPAARVCIQHHTASHIDTGDDATSTDEEGEEIHTHHHHNHEDAHSRTHDDDRDDQVVPSPMCIPSTSIKNL